MICGGSSRTRSDFAAAAELYLPSLCDPLAAGTAPWPDGRGPPPCEHCAWAALLF
jgi:hypothetical protein